MIKRSLSVIDGFEFPIDAVTQKFAWLGRSGSGKSYGCKRFVEQMLNAGAQVVVIDTVGVWFGLRQGAKGFSIPVLGGLYGDIPLEPSSGALVAEVTVLHGASLVLDVSHMSDAGKAKFMEAFGRRLFELKKQTPGAMHVVVDEGQDIVPQNPQPNENMMLHEWVRIAKQGRAFGMGLSIVSQRPQEVSKKVLNQAECVLAFQLTGPHERKALEYWLADKGIDDKGLSKLLPSLDIGKPFVWSPQWLKVSSVLGRILPIDSDDTSQTPQVGDAPRAARAMKPIDLGALRASMESAVEEAQKNDPAELRKEVARLRAQLEQQKPRVNLSSAIAALAEIQSKTQTLMEELDAESKTHRVSEPRKAPEPEIVPQRIPRSRTKPASDAPAASVESSVKLELVDKKLLTVLATHGTMSLTRAAMLAGYPTTASTVRNSATRLRGFGFVQGGNGALTITPEGKPYTGRVELPPKKPAERLEYWCGKLDKVDAEILRVLFKAKKAMVYSDAAAAAGYDPKKSTARNSVTRLRGLGLINGKNAEGLSIAPEMRS